MFDKPKPEIEGVIIIAGDLHCKSPEAEKNLLEWLSIDYEIKDCSKNETHPRDGYYANLKESVHQRLAKCDFCGHYNTRVASKCHGFTCSGCNKVIFREYLPKARVRLYFREDNGMRYMNFLIHSYDEVNKCLLVYAKPQKSQQDFFVVSSEQMPAHLEKHKDFFKVVYHGKVKLLSFYLPTRGVERDNDKVKVNVAEVGHPPYKKVPNPQKYGGYDYILDPEDCKQNYTEVQMFKDEEFVGDMGSALPVHASFSVHLTYKHLPEKNENLSRCIISAAGQVADCGYYCQSDKQCFYNIQFEWMANFIEHFTGMDVDDFRRFVRYADKSGPGFICDFAAWVEKQMGVKQYVKRRRVSIRRGEIVAAKQALDDD